MSHLDMGEEASLHKAKDFSSKHLACAIRYLNPDLARYVRQSLDHPYHLILMQYKARHHLSYLPSQPNRKSTAAIEELATAEFHLNKLLHQKEMEEVKRWNTAAADSLPSCMRSCYKALYTIMNEIADAAEKEHGMNPVNHLRKAWAELFAGFMVESKWLAAGLVPATEDYLRNGVVTSGISLTLAHVLFLLGQDHAAYSDATKLTDHIPLAISCPGKILRLWDDMGSAEDEAQEGLDGSYRDLYLMENPSCTPADAEEHMRRMIKREWEELNRECFSRRIFSSSFMQACLNAARMVSVMYSYDKEQRLLVLEDYARMLLL